MKNFYFYFMACGLFKTQLPTHTYKQKSGVKHGTPKGERLCHGRAEFPAPAVWLWAQQWTGPSQRPQAPGTELQDQGRGAGLAGPRCREVWGQGSPWDLNRSSQQKTFVSETVLSQSHQKLCWSLETNTWFSLLHSPCSGQKTVSPQLPSYISWSQPWAGIDSPSVPISDAKGENVVSDLL